MTTATVPKEELLELPPWEIRALIREGRWTSGTEGLGKGYAQANLVIVPQEAAFDFLLFCLRNPKPCPIVEVTEPGSPMIRQVAEEADLRTDLSRYCVYQHGELTAEEEDITDYWRDDLVGFLIGCSYSFETALLNANIPLKHIEEGQDRLPLPDRHRVRTRGPVRRSHGRQHAADQAPSGGPGGSGNLPLPGHSRGSGPHRRSVGHRHLGSR